MYGWNYFSDEDEDDDYREDLNPGDWNPYVGRCALCGRKIREDEMILNSETLTMICDRCAQEEK